MDLREVACSAQCQGISDDFGKGKYSTVAIIRGRCVYYHYLCDGMNDRGWGCGYRTLQTICSYCLCFQKDGHSYKDGEETRDIQTAHTHRQNVATSVSGEDELECAKHHQRVPSISEIQQTLVAIGDKPDTFLESKQWIGTFEVSIVLDQLFGTPCRLLHAPNGSGAVLALVPQLLQHFTSEGSPVMIGGDKDASSKTLIGVCFDDSKPSDSWFLIADPHYVGDSSNSETLYSGGHVEWKTFAATFDEESFYNFCLPLVSKMTL